MMPRASHAVRPPLPHSTHRHNTRTLTNTHMHRRQARQARQALLAPPLRSAEAGRSTPSSSAGGWSARTRGRVAMRGGSVARVVTRLRDVVSRVVARTRAGAVPDARRPSYTGSGAPSRSRFSQTSKGAQARSL